MLASAPAQQLTAGQRRICSVPAARPQTALPSARAGACPSQQAAPCYPLSAPCVSAPSRACRSGHSRLIGRAASAPGGSSPSTRAVAPKPPYNVVITGSTKGEARQGVPRYGADGACRTRTRNTHFSGHGHALHSTSWTCLPTTAAMGGKWPLGMPGGLCYETGSISPWDGRTPTPTTNCTLAITPPLLRATQQ